MNLSEQFVKLLSLRRQRHKQIQSCGSWRDIREAWLTSHPNFQCQMFFRRVDKHAAFTQRSLKYDAHQERDFEKKAMRSIKIKRNINLLRQYPFCHFLCTVGQLLVVQTHDSCIKSTECKWTEGAQIYSTTKYRRTPTNSSTETFLTFSLQSAGTGCSSAGLLRCVTWRLMKACKSLPHPQ